MLIDNVFPPIPSEVIMPLAGFAAARGQLSLIGVFLAGTAGSLSGALVWYGVGRWVGRERLKRFAARHGRWLTLSPAEIDRAGGWFARRGGITVLVGRVIPGVRSLISVPAGVAGMPLTPFLVYSAVGTIVWNRAAGRGRLRARRELQRRGALHRAHRKRRAGPGPGALPLPCRHLRAPQRRSGLTRGGNSPLPARSKPLQGGGGRAGP